MDVPPINLISAAPLNDGKMIEIQEKKEAWSIDVKKIVFLDFSRQRITGSIFGESGNGENC